MPQLVRKSQEPSEARLAARCRSQWRLVRRGPELAVVVSSARWPSADAVVGSRPMRGTARLTRQTPTSRRMARKARRATMAVWRAHFEVVLSFRCSSNSSQEPWSEGGEEHVRRACQLVARAGAERDGGLKTASARPRLKSCLHRTNLAVRPHCERSVGSVRRRGGGEGDRGGG